MILWCLETSTHPFKTPKSLPIRSKTTYSASVLDDILDRSVSRACHRESCIRDYEKRYTELEAYEKEYGTTLVSHSSSIRKMPSMKSSISSSQLQKIPGAYPTDSRKRSSDSSLSTWSGTSDFSGYSGTTYIGPQRPRRARPTSSVGSSTRRSPLSTMRYVTPTQLYTYLPFSSSTKISG